MIAPVHPDEARRIVDTLEPEPTPEALLRSLAEEWIDLPRELRRTVGRELWDGWVEAAKVVSESIVSHMPGFEVLFDDLCNALTAYRDASNDPTLYAERLYEDVPFIGQFQRDAAYDHACALVDDALSALLRPARGTA